MVWMNRTSSLREMPESNLDKVESKKAVAIGQLRNKHMVLERPLIREGSDVTLIVNTRQFPCHKQVLSEKSPYFRSLFYGSFKESKQSEIELHNISEEAFSMLLVYVYNNNVNFKCLTLELLLEFYQIAHFYAFDHLQNIIGEHLKTRLSLDNFSIIYDFVKFYENKSLVEFCLSYSDSLSSKIVNGNAVMDFSVSCIKDILSRDTFCENEIDIFNLASRLLADRGLEMEELLEVIRLPLIEERDLLEKVAPTRLFPLFRIMQARNVFKRSNADSELRARLIPEKNVASKPYDVKVMREMDFNSFDVDKTFLFQKKGFVTHDIDSTEQDMVNQEGILIKLNNLYFINCIQMLLLDDKKQDLNERKYSYFIEVFNGHNWFCVFDRRNKLCKSLQTIYFPTKAANYIRIVGTNCTIGTKFDILSFECKHTVKSRVENSIDNSEF